MKTAREGELPAQIAAWFKLYRAGGTWGKSQKPGGRQALRRSVTRRARLAGAGLGDGAGLKFPP